MTDSRIDAWHAVFALLHEHNPQFTNSTRTGGEDALFEIKALQKQDKRFVEGDTEPGIYVGRATDAGIANRIRSSVRGLQLNLEEAKRRGINVQIAVGFNKALQWPQHYLTEGEPIEVKSISKTATQTL